MDTYLVFGYGGVGIFLLFRATYLYERLKRYVDRQYPEEAVIIRSHEWQWYPWSTQARTLRALIKKQSSSDPELVHRSKKAKRALIYFIAWPLVIALIFFSIAFYNTLTQAK